MVERYMMFNQCEDPDPYPFVAISPEQQLLLDNSLFVGDTRFPTYELPVDAAEIPPLPSTDDQQENLIVVEVQHCEVNEAVEIDAGTQGGVALGEVRGISEVVGLGKGSKLGFSEALLELNAKNLLEEDNGRGS